MQRLIQGKFLRPQPGPDYMLRPRLCEQLDAGIGGGLTLIAAPAGYGKSTLLSTWSQHCTLPCTWLALDANDDDLPTFLCYLIGAIRAIYPDACAGTFALLNARQEAPAAYLRNTLITDLADLPDPWVLVLDDYHMIGTEAIHQLVTDLLHYCPGRPHLVIASRHNPPLPLAWLRAADTLNEIRLADLRFTHAEMVDYLSRALPLAPAPAAIALLAERTEGWPAGLRLATLALNGKTDYAGFLSSVSGTGRFVMEYLVEEVLAGQPPAVQSFLQRTALLDRLCAPLCDAVMAVAMPDPAGSSLATGEAAYHSSQAMLEYLARHNLFVIPLDDEQHCYRYHHLFQDLLLHHLKTKTSAEQRASLHLAASHWLEGQGMLREAIDQALATGNRDHVAQLIGRWRASLLNQTRWLQIEQCLKYVPPDQRRQDPALLMLETWGHYHRGHWDMLPAALSQVTAALARTALDPAVE